MDLTVINHRPIVAEEYVALQAIDAKNAELRARNEERLKAAKIALGTKYVLHPDNSPKKQTHHNVLDKKA